MLLVGLTGGIASGKTLVSQAFAELDVPVISADVLAREVVARGSDGLAALQAEFGDDIIQRDGTLDRAALRKLIFEDASLRKIVDGLLHPRIHTLFEQQAQAYAEQGHCYLIYEVPLLVETGAENRFDRILLVDVDTEIQLARLQKRDGGSRAEAEAILAVQASRQQRLDVADDVIDNSNGTDAVTAQVRKLHLRYRELAGCDAG